MDIESLRERELSARFISYSMLQNTFSIILMGYKLVYLQNTVECGKRFFALDIARLNTYIKQNKNIDNFFF